MSGSVYCDAEKRHDFVFLFDVNHGNPNGDPEAGNLPRVDPETMHGLVTDVAVKRKIRDWVDVTHGNEEYYQIYVQNKGIALNDLHKLAHETIFGNTYVEKDLQEEADGSRQESKRQSAKRGGSNRGKDSSDGAKQDPRQQEEARRDWMCRHFYDVRTFGAVMSTGEYPSGQVRGPIQLTFSRSINPIVPLDLAITRVAITQSGTDKKTMIGRKALVPYALYMGYGFVIPHFARQTGFSSQDLELFWSALQSAWEIDRSASRGMLALRGLYIFSHDHSLGKAPAHRLFERIQPRLVEGVLTPRHITDYVVSVNDADLPEGVILTKMEV